MAVGIVTSVSLSAAQPVDFTTEVAPVLQKYCVGCHSQDEPEGGLDLSSHAAVLAGGDSGLAITPASATSSRLALMVSGRMEPSMPPEDEAQPSPAEVELLAAWIEQGAAGPAGDRPLKQELRVPEIQTAGNLPTPTTAIAYSDDGRLRAVARYGAIELQDASGAIIVTLTAELRKVHALQFNRDGSRLLAASGVAGVYGNAVLFAIPRGDEAAASLIREFTDHRDVLYAAEFSPDETQIATAGYDRVITLWDVESGEVLRRFAGHNGAVFDLAFSPDGKALVSASADETAKLWRVATGERLDTLGQPEGEVFAVEVTPDGRFIVAASADNRLRVWRLQSTQDAGINPLAAMRFVDDTPLTAVQITPDGKTAVVLSQAGNLKLIATADWNQFAALDAARGASGALAVTSDSRTVAIGTSGGEIALRSLPEPNRDRSATAQKIEPIYLDLPTETALAEQELRDQARQQQGESEATAPLVHSVPRAVRISGSISVAGETDFYQWRARAGEVWAIDADAVADSPLDPVAAVLDEQRSPVLRTRLQATHKTYFTFRGKNSSQTTDFRLFNWQNLELSGYLYAAGEVTRLWMHPRGPDSGFNVYPGVGDRWTYFGTTHAAHAMGDPAYMVRPLRPGEQPADNGLPTFDVHYENDDDPMRNAGKNSRLLFTAPCDGLFTVRIGDTRQMGGSDFKYELAIRPAAPTFIPSVAEANGDLRPGTGREFVVSVQRIDGFDGPTTFDLIDLPEAIAANVPLTVESEQQSATGVLWIGGDATAWEGAVEPQLVAYADINGRRVERHVGRVGALKLGEPPTVVATLHPVDRAARPDENWTLQVQRGETAKARVLVQRNGEQTQEIPFGKEFSGRNAAHGVYVDNIGLNGLRVMGHEVERTFFVTADPAAEPGHRSFFLTADVDGGVTTQPITVEVLP